VLGLPRLGFYVLPIINKRKKFWWKWHPPPILLQSTTQSSDVQWCRMKKHKEAKRREKFMNFMMLLCSMKYIQQFWCQLVSQGPRWIERWLNSRISKMDFQFWAMWAVIPVWEKFFNFSKVSYFWWYLVLFFLYFHGQRNSWLTWKWENVNFGFKLYFLSSK
jgi:hypothetical protein